MGVQKLLAARSGKPGTPKGATGPPQAVNDQAAAPAEKGKAPPHGKPKHGKGAHEAAAEEKPKAEGAPGADAAAEGKAADAKVPVKMHMPEPPTKPSKATMGRIAGVKSRAGSKAKAQGALPPAAKQVGDAQKGVTPPDAERVAEARAKLIAEVHAAPSPEIVKLCERIRQVIRDKRPPDEDALASAEPAKEAAEAGGQLNSTVQNESKKVQDNYGSMNSEPGTAPAKPGAPVPPQPGAAPTPLVNAKAATPDPVPGDKVSLDKDAEDAKKKTDAAGMNKPAAALVQSGPIAEAREAQGELDETAKESPAEVLAKQKEALAKADEDMAALQMRALQALTEARSGTAGKSTQRQKGMVGTEEQMRAQAGAEAKAAFDEAQTTVRGLLKDLTPNAMNKWETAKAALTKQFKDDLAIVKKRVDERHSGVGGFVVGLWDAVTGLPDWATDAYDRAEKNFGEGVIAKLTEISTEVNSVILACEGIIKKARDKIAEIFASLPDSLKTWAANEQAKFDKDLDKLGDEVTAERNAFNKDITERASQAVDEVRAEIADLRKKAGGLIGRIVDAVKRFVDDPVKFIIEGLLELLGISPPAFWAVVAKIKKVVKDIVDDPMNFANNLMKGIGQGFSQFFDNFPEHMLKGFLSWLLGDLKDVQIPKDLSLKSIITFFLQIMGITWPNIRKILAKKIGEKNVALIEKVYSLISMLIEKGPEGIYEMIKEKLDPQAIVDQVVQMAVEYMVTAIVKAVAARLIMMFNPAGAILQAIEAIYKVLKWVFENAAKIFTLIETIVNGLADIIAGNVGGFANAVEKGLAMLIAPVLGFIADYLGFGDLPKAVAKQIKGFREWILGKIEAGFDWVIAKGKQLLAALGIGKKEEKDKGGTENEQAAREVAAALSEPPGGETKPYAETRGTKEKEAADLAAKHNQILSAQKLKMTITFEAPDKDQKDDDLDFTILIAPNNTKLKASTPTSGLPPIGGPHRLHRSPPVAGDKSESHHVPPKALRKAIADVYNGAAKRLETGKKWQGIPAAQKAATSLKKKAEQVIKLHGEEGMKLSAILLTAQFHDEVHSIAGATSLFEEADNNPEFDDLVFCRRKTVTALKNYIHTNPTTPSWIQFISDVRKQVKGKLSTATKDIARPDPPENVALAILDEAETAIPAGLSKSEVYIENVILPDLQSTVGDAIDSAYNTGVGLVRSASANKDKNFQDALNTALGTMEATFTATWKGQIAQI